MRGPLVHSAHTAVGRKETVPERSREKEGAVPKTQPPGPWRGAMNNGHFQAGPREAGGNKRGFGSDVTEEVLSRRRE